MDYENLCIGCFSKKGEQEVCPSCQYQEDNSLETSLYLKPRTILNGKYLIGRNIGQGGFGITYLGWDLTLNIRLAVKEFFPRGLVSRHPEKNKVISYTGESKSRFTFGLEKFLNEAKTLAQFEHHPNIVTVRDFFEANGTAYMIMSYIEGMTFEKCLIKEGGKISLNKTMDIAIPVMEALKDIHEMGIMHRDISPDNILIDNKGKVVLIDFGAARQDIQESNKSISVILKTGYAPEEQYNSRGEQGPWTDIYALAATVYRAVTGEVPTASINRLTGDTLSAPSSLGVNISEEQEESLLKALSIKAEDRYRSVEDFQASFTGQSKTNEDTESIDHKSCPHCGKEIKSGAVKCKHCLASIDEETNAAKSATSRFTDLQKKVTREDRKTASESVKEKTSSDKPLKPLLHSAVKTGSAILLLLVARAIIVNLPMLKAIDLPLNFSFNDIISAATLTIVAVLLFQLGIKVENQMINISRGLPQFENAIRGLFLLAVLLIIYIAYQPLALPYLAAFSWFYHLLFLAASIYIIWSLGLFIYQNTENIAKLIANKGRQLTTGNPYPFLSCKNCGEHYPSNSNSYFCAKCGKKLR